jgi:hypothetical protein
MKIIIPFILLANMSCATTYDYQITEQEQATFLGVCNQTSRTPTWCACFTDYVTSHVPHRVFSALVTPNFDGARGKVKDDPELSAIMADGREYCD